MDTRFNELFSTYIQNARAAVNQDRSERQLVALFTDFVSKGFDVGSIKKMRQCQLQKWISYI
jgi:hypothetical protein